MAPAALALSGGAALLVAIVAFTGDRDVRKTTGGGREAPAPTLLSAETNLPTPNEAERKAFRLTVESTPSGAEVVDATRGPDAGMFLGRTPLSLAISNAEARSAPRLLTIRRDGYEPYSLVQGPSDENVRILATLVPARPSELASSSNTDDNDASQSASHTPSGARPRTEGRPDAKPDARPGRPTPLPEIRLTR
jgi:serine/threonine-protein kinase